MRGKRYRVWNEAYTKGDCHKKLKKFRIGSYELVERLKKKIFTFRLKFPRKFTRTLHNTNPMGEYVYHSKNSSDCYQVTDVEESRFRQFIALKFTRDF